MRPWVQSVRPCPKCDGCLTYEYSEGEYTEGVVDHYHCDTCRHTQDIISRYEPVTHETRLSEKYGE